MNETCVMINVMLATFTGLITIYSIFTRREHERESKALVADKCLKARELIREALSVVACPSHCSAKVVKVDRLPADTFPAGDYGERANLDETVHRCLICPNDCKNRKACSLVNTLLATRDGKIHPAAVGILRVKAHLVGRDGTVVPVLDDYSETDVLTIDSVVCDYKCYPLATNAAKTLDGKTEQTDPA